VSETEETPLETIVQSMADADVHRIIILDPEGRLPGLISSTDVLAALLNAGRVSGSRFPY
jgi:CBS-domain-containing membrane protein